MQSLALRTCHARTRSYHAATPQHACASLFREILVRLDIAGHSVNNNVRVDEYDVNVYMYMYMYMYVYVCGDTCICRCSQFC